MKLQQLKYVVKVAEVGNITEASRRLFVSTIWSERWASSSSNARTRASW